MKTLLEITKNDVGTIDREFYAEFVAEAEIELAPSGIMELCHAAEIVRALWRLRQLATIDETELRGEMREAVERAIRAKNRTLKLNRQMLREIQTDKQIRNRFGLPVTGLASTKDYLRAEKQLSRTNPEPRPAPAPPEPPAVFETAPDPGLDNLTNLTTQIQAVENCLNGLLKDFTAPTVPDFGFLKKRTHFGPGAAHTDTSQPAGGRSAPTQATPKAA